MQTWLEETWGLTVPVIGAPMAGPGGGRLAAAISAAGALGMIGVGGSRDRDWIAQQAATAAEAGRPYGIGLMAWALERDDRGLEAVLALPEEHRPALVSVSFGELTGPVRRLQEAGIRTATQVGDLADLARAEEAGVDLVVARGGEGGGHGRDTMATLPLLQLVLERTDRPVVAAGGIINHRGVAAVLAAGAAGAWVGTAFLGCAEADNTPEARQALFAARDTGYGRVFDVVQQVPWPREYGGRAVANPFFTEWAGREEQIGPDARERHQRAVAAQDFSAAHLYAGEGVAALTGERTAAEVVESLTPRAAR
ncbi:MAG TPA: nitronate monooxygenase [Marmoricola sp.]|nr:nitronate monooxygenase [Marmoricola sp.]